MEKFELHILGCGSALPTTRHFPTSQIVNVRDKLFMIDCGEGAQLQFRKSHLKFSRLNHIFISHLHGDHCFGLLGSVTFYGIDFTRAKVYGAKEGPMQFKYTFDDINKLFITEPKKYDIGKRLGVNVEVTSLEAVNDANKTINPDEIMTTNSGYTLDEKQIEEVIKTLPILSQEEKTGLIMVAMLLNKADARATYQIVFFNTKTREILYSAPTNGKARGFGLRNYWAGSVHSAMKKLD